MPLHTSTQSFAGSCETAFRAGLGGGPSPALEPREICTEAIFRIVQARAIPLALVRRRPGRWSILPPMKARENAGLLAPTSTFVERHIGLNDRDINDMLRAVECTSLDELVAQTLPSDIRLTRPLALGGPRSEHDVLDQLRGIAAKNRVLRSFVGMGYYGCVIPAVVQRNVLEQPGWYTQYTPYQAEISQGRLEVLLAFQTMVSDLTGLPISNASLLDEATAAAEAMHICHAVARGGASRFFVASDCHPQTIAVIQTRAEALGIEVVVGELDNVEPTDCFGALVQYPNTFGRIVDVRGFVARMHVGGVPCVVATDLLALTLLEPPGAFGADIAIGSTQRFGVPFGYGGPHAAFLACKDEYKRQMPGRIIGVSRDARGQLAYRMAMQTREQHIRREKATSNICTAQVLLAIMATMYAVYHGPEGLRRIAARVHAATRVLERGLRKLGVHVEDGVFFDTIRIDVGQNGTASVVARAHARGLDIRCFDDRFLGVSLDETVTSHDIESLLRIVAGRAHLDVSVASLEQDLDVAIPRPFARTGGYLTHPVFNSYHSEHELLRFLQRLQARDLSLTTSMIPLGSCTMKLNATAEMLPVSWPEFANMHPFAPTEHAAGYGELIAGLERWLAEITGFAAVSLQPNAGSQGEYAGLLVIRAYHRDRGHEHRNVCLIPVSAHGTNPASAVMAGMKVVVVKCDEAGNIHVDDLRAKATKHAHELAALMVTYPSTHGVFETSIRDICSIVHEAGGQVYLDGANMNAQVGLCRPGDYGADVCHLNLHKTFCIPHGGGGPGMGPIGVASHLAAFLPGHGLVRTGGTKAIGPVAAAPWGSPSILTISWMYIAMMGAEGLKKASQVAILNANYMARRLSHAYPILYTGQNRRIAHEFIIDLRPFKQTAGIEAEDVAKRLMDFGFHAPTMSFPVAGTLMIEPTESESRAELDRFCEAMLAIRGEIAGIEAGKIDRENNPLKHAPHTVDVVTASEWNRPYTREQAAFPAGWLRDHKFWPYVGRVDNAWGDRNLVCTCPPVTDYAPAPGVGT